MNLNDDQIKIDIENQQKANELQDYIQIEVSKKTVFDSIQDKI